MSVSAQAMNEQARTMRIRFRPIRFEDFFEFFFTSSSLQERFRSHASGTILPFGTDADFLFLTKSSAE